MSKKKIVLEFVFDEVEDPYEPGYFLLELDKIKLGKATTMSQEERDGITEHWGQSDQWHVDIHNDILTVIDSGKSIRYI